VSEQQNRPHKLRLLLFDVGVDTIVYDPNSLGKSLFVEISTFRAGGSAIAIFSNTELSFHTDFLDAT